MVDETEIEKHKKNESRKKIWTDELIGSVQCSKPSNIQSETFSVGMEKIKELGP